MIEISNIMVNYISSVRAMNSKLLELLIVTHLLKHLQPSRSLRCRHAAITLDTRVKTRPREGDGFSENAD